MSENGKKKKVYQCFWRPGWNPQMSCLVHNPKILLTLGAKVSLLVSDLQTGSLHKMTREQWCVWSSSFSLWVNLQSSSLPLLVILEVRERFNVRVSVTLNSAYHAAVNGWTWPDGGCVVFFFVFFCLLFKRRVNLFDLSPGHTCFFRLPEEKMLEFKGGLTSLLTCRSSGFILCLLYILNPTSVLPLVTTSHI